MRAATLRRLLVFGVCALGVGALYLAPSTARSPDQVGGPTVSDEPTQVFTSGSSTRAPGPGASPIGAAGGTATGSTRPSAMPTSIDYGPGGGQRRPVRGATAYDPKNNDDVEAPTAVESIRPAKVTKGKLSLTWAPASDNVAVVSYRVLLNGFPVATTKQTHAEVSWFNDDVGQHVVQVRAVDRRGNESQSSPTLVVTRPSTDPATPSAEPSPTTAPPEPTSPPEPTVTPEPAAEASSPAATVEAAEPAEADPEPSASSTP